MTSIPTWMFWVFVVQSGIVVLLAIGMLIDFIAYLVSERKVKEYLMDKDADEIINGKKKEK